MTLHEKTEWVTPELITLARTRSEEAVLAVCKWETISGPNTERMNCYTTAGACVNCWYISTS